MIQLPCMLALGCHTWEGLQGGGGLHKEGFAQGVRVRSLLRGRGSFTQGGIAPTVPYCLTALPKDLDTNELT